MPPPCPPTCELFKTDRKKQENGENKSLMNVNNHIAHSSGFPPSLCKHSRVPRWHMRHPHRQSASPLLQPTDRPTAFSHEEKSLSLNRDGALPGMD